MNQPYSTIHQCRITYTFRDIQPSTPNDTTNEDSVSPSLMQGGHVNISEDDSTDSLFLAPVLLASCDDLATPRNSNIYDVCEDIVSPTTYIEDSSGYFKPKDLSREVSLSSFGNGGDDLPHKGIDDDNIYDADGYVQASL